MKKLAISIAFVLIAIAILSGCTTFHNDFNFKGVYSQELSEQFSKATNSELVSLPDGNKMITAGRIGTIDRIYLKNNIASLYRIGVYPGAQETFIENLTIDANGIITTMFENNHDAYTAYVTRYFGGTVPPSGLVYYLYTGQFSKGYNTILYTKDFLHDEKYAEVKGFGIYENGNITIYNFAGE